MPRLLELFAGTGSVGKSFKKLGWEVVSLDWHGGHHPTICCDLLTWDYRVFPDDHFQCIHASPPCEQYSIARTTAKTPRNLELADSLVRRSLEIINYFAPKAWIIENPATSMMSRREVMAHMVPFRHVVTYCKYGTKYRKATAIWTNLENWAPRPACSKASPCEYRVDGRHPTSAQRGPGKKGGVRTASIEDTCSLDQLHAIPEALCDELARVTHSTVGL